MNLNAAAQRGGSLLAGDDTAERVAALASTTMAGTTFGPGLLPRSGLDQALATGIVAATNHGLVTTSQSACAALGRRFARDDGTPSGRARAYLAQVAVSAGADAAAGGRRPALRLLAAGGGLLAGAGLAGRQIHRFHAGERTDPSPSGRTPCGTRSCTKACPARGHRHSIADAICCLIKADFVHSC